MRFEQLRLTTDASNTEFSRPHLGKVLALQNAALVSRPAPLPGVLYWTIAPRAAAPGVQDMATSPDGRLLAIGSGGNVYIVDSANGDLVKRLPGSNTTVNWSPDGSQLAVTHQHDATIWDTKTWERKHQFRHTADRAQNCVAWSPDGAVLAMGNHYSEKGRLFL